MSIQDPTSDPRQNPYGQQPAPGTTAYQPVADPAAQGGAGQVPPTDAYGNSYPGAGYPSAPLPGAPNPGLAALLGFIPGVGAMYNGQFPKGIAHIAIFAVFSSLSKNVNGIFGLFVAGWVFYMVFEAYQTARARRDGLPLPDPFGLNNIGERFGFRGNPDFSSFWSHGAPPAPGSAPFSAADTSPVDPLTGSPYGFRPDGRTDARQAVTGASAAYQVDPAGNVYRAATPGYSAPGPAEYPAQPVPPPAGYPPPPMGYPPYGVPPAGQGPAYGTAPFGMPPIPPVPPTLRNGLPAGALWLIGLGFFALLGSLRSFAFLEGEATGGLFLIGLSVFLFWRSYNSGRMLYPAGSPAARWNLVRASRGAATVFVVGLLTLLQGLHIVDWEYSWPFLLIFLGVFILLERFAQNSMSANPYPVGYPGQPAAPAEEQVVETSSPTSILPRYSQPDNDLNRTEGR